MDKWHSKKYTKEQFIETWYSSGSITEIVEKLIGVMNTGYVSGGNWNTINQLGTKLNLDKSHFKKREFSGKRSKIPIANILVENSTYLNTSNLKQRLFKEEIKEKKCERCGLTEWQDNPAPLCLDHINGVRTDNRLDNLRILCYNCHGLTDTYCGKNIKGSNKERKCSCGNTLKPYKKKCSNCLSVRFNLTCDMCGTKTVKVSRCISCAASLKRKIDWPPMEELIARLDSSNYSKLARELGVSDNAIRKHIKNHGSGTGWTGKKL